MVLYFCILYHRSETKAIFFSVSLQFYPSQDVQKDLPLTRQVFLARQKGLEPSTLRTGK